MRFKVSNIFFGFVVIGSFFLTGCCCMCKNTHSKDCKAFQYTVDQMKDLDGSTKVCKYYR